MKMTLFASVASLALADQAWLPAVGKLAAILAPVVVGAVQAWRRPPKRVRKPAKKKLPVAQATLLGCLCLASGCTTNNPTTFVSALRHNTNAWTLSYDGPIGRIGVTRNAALPLKN
jgi:hypothetical protein